MGKEWEPETLFDILGSEYAREILAIGSVQPVSAEELATHLDASLPTVYRRINALQEYDLLREETRIDERGNHYSTFETTLDRVCFEIEDGGYEIDVELRRDTVDQFEAFWNDLGRGTDQNDNSNGNG